MKQSRLEPLNPVTTGLPILPTTAERFSLSPRERAGVRGNVTQLQPLKSYPQNAANWSSLT